MFMWFHGGRIGHKAICNWDEFLLLEGHGHDKAVVMFWPSLAQKLWLWPGFRQLGIAKIPGQAKAASDGWLWLGFGMSCGPSTENGEKCSEHNLYHGVSI
jgi:hypothetical protein